eukprot:gene22384-28980_t
MSIVKQCKIIVVDGPFYNEESGHMIPLARLPQGSEILVIGSNVEVIKSKNPSALKEANCLLYFGWREILEAIVNEMSNLEWIHSLSSGVDHFLYPQLLQSPIIITNAKGAFSSLLAEYTMAAISYFAKDLPRLIRQKEEKLWEKFFVTEIRGKTMGIVGYGDIGLACAKLGKAYGMRVIGLRRRPELSANDEFIDKILTFNKINEIMEESDYLVVAAAVTPDTINMINKDVLMHAKKNQVIINLGRGALINEDDLIESLQNGSLQGAALDVFATEPLPKDSKLWELSNVLLSPHNGGLRPDYAEMTANVILNCFGSKNILEPIVSAMPNLVWIHSLSAGIDHMLYPDLINSSIILTNAKGVYNSTLAEYTMAAISYFAKDLPRLIRQKEEKLWEKFFVTEIRGKTMGIVGYGDIGLACAKLGKAYGMRVIGLRRRPELSANDEFIDRVYHTDKLNDVIAESDYLVVAAPLTSQTYHLIKAENLKFAKTGQVLINVGRGAVIDENALISALEDGRLAGAALDVTTVEPLPIQSKLWSLPNVLISPHNADMTFDFKHQSMKLFCKLCLNFINNEQLLYIVDKESGY